jgi:hypothetical protein
LLHDGYLTSRDISLTAASIVAGQGRDGAIPWFSGGVLDPWDHVEAAMALDVGERPEEASRAYGWLASTQRADGAWPAGLLDGEIVDPTLDANFVAYVAVGVWHHYLCTTDEGFLHRSWRMVERAIDFVLDLQLEDGSIAWARDSAYRPWPGALLTSSSCIHLSLGCALAHAQRLGYERPDWELSLSTLAEAVRSETPSFEDKSRFAMDWYYPIIGGVLTGDEARARIDGRWDEFVIDGRGSRCVTDRPWVTTGETAELIVALALADRSDAAREVLGWIQRLRTDDGSYWTGATYPEDTVWPREKPNWCGGAILLADAVLRHGTPTQRIFSGEAVVRATLSDRIPDAL